MSDNPIRLEFVERMKAERENKLIEKQKATRNKVMQHIRILKKMADISPQQSSY